jgi:uncharacterized protein YggT (Ycf19 family)
MPFFQILIGNILTLYMMAILLRWTAPWLEVDLRSGLLQWIPRSVDPAIRMVRRFLPPMGGMFDWAPPATLFLVWVIRVLLARY